MKKIFLILFIATATISSCKKKKGCTDATALNYDKEADTDDESCSYNGTLTLWKKSGVSNNINVTIDGTTKVITASYVSSPDCGSNGCATFTLAPGTYTYSADEVSTSSHWGSNIQIKSKQCLTLELH